MGRSGRQPRRGARDSGLTTAELADPAGIAALDPERALVAVAADPAAPLARLRAANEACVRLGVPLLPIGAFDGATVDVGPLILPGHTACAECLQQRLAANVAYPQEFPHVADAPAAPTVAAVSAWGNAIATLIALLWVTTRDPDLPGRLHRLDPQSLSIRPSRVYRVPRCPACMAPDFTPAPAPWAASRDH